MVELKFHCKMPIMVARQWIRHRMANVNEYSGRYSLMPMQFYTPKREQVATQSKSNKQGRTDNMLQLEEYDSFVHTLQEMRNTGQIFYESALQQDVAREVARLEMPLSLYTEWYWKIDLHNLLHFLGLRCHPHAQWEVRQYANVMASMTKRLVPDAFSAWFDYHPNMGGKLLSRTELAVLRHFVTTNGADAGADAGRWLDPAERTPNSERFLAADASWSSREISAFLDLFDSTKFPPPYPYFELDVSTARSPQFFADEAKKYVPVIDK